MSRILVWDLPTRVFWHTARHRENIGRSMIDGRTEGPPEAALRSHRALSGVFMATGVLTFAIALFRNYDPATARVRLPASARNRGSTRRVAPHGWPRARRVRAYPHD